MAISLASLQKNFLKPPRITLHGGPGVGKTTFGVSAPAPVVIQTEDGLGDLDATAFPLATRYEEVGESLSALLNEEHDFQTLVVDSLDWLEPLIWDRVCRDHQITSIESLGYGKGYVEAMRHWRDFFQSITALRDSKNMMVVMIAHSQVVRLEDPMQPAYDTHDLKLHKRASALAEEYSDVILYAAFKTVTKTENTGFTKRNRALATGERVIYTSGNPAYTAKNRYRLPPELPLDWSAFAEAMGM